MLVSPTNSCVEAFTSNMAKFGDWPFPNYSSMRSWVGPWSDRISVFRGRRRQQITLSELRPAERSALKPRKRAENQTYPPATWSLQDLRGSSKFLLFQPQSMACCYGRPRAVMVIVIIRPFIKCSPHRKLYGSFH